MNILPSPLPYTTTTTILGPMFWDKRTVRNRGKKTDTPLVGKPLDDVASMYSVDWYSQADGYHNLSIHLTPDRCMTRLRTKIHYLDEVLSNVFVNFVGNRYFSYYLRVSVGGVYREVEDYGSFCPSRIIILLMDLGISSVFKQSVIMVELREIVYWQ